MSSPLAETPGGPRGDAEDEPVGSLAEEAVKLFAVLRARAEGEDARGTTLLGSLVSAVRGTSPEVRSHLTAAATSLVSAAAAALATPVPHEPDDGDPEADPLQDRDPPAAQQEAR